MERCTVAERARATTNTASGITLDLLVGDLFRVLDAVDIEKCVLAANRPVRPSSSKLRFSRPTRFEGRRSMPGPGADRQPDLHPNG
jgi:hypothetical protein